MSDPLYFLPPRGAFVDPRTGELSRAAVMFFKTLFDRVGGSMGMSTTDLALSMPQIGAAEEVRGELERLSDDLAVMPRAEPLPPSDDDTTQRIAALEALVAELRKDLDALRVGTIVL